MVRTTADHKAVLLQVEVEGCVLNEWLLECGSSAIYDNSQVTLVLCYFAQRRPW